MLEYDSQCQYTKTSKFLCVVRGNVLPWKAIYQPTPRNPMKKRPRCARVSYTFLRPLKLRKVSRNRMIPWIAWLCKAEPCQTHKLRLSEGKMKHSGFQKVYPNRNVAYKAKLRGTTDPILLLHKKSYRVSYHSCMRAC